MSIHFHDYNSVEGRLTACGRYYENGKPLGRGVVITTNVREVSCQKCLGSERHRLARARLRRDLDDPRPLKVAARAAQGGTPASAEREE